MFDEQEEWNIRRIEGMSEALQVSLYDCDAKEWDSFVHNHDNATFLHQIGWKNAIEKTYGH